ncbi:zinc finger CCCH-type antiviral protein 1-like isoform X2 [Eublepharis macularius]|uniref:Zinc finger CCCH-type antiviral protein 1-like isoform X2 n=1 Tax=Eublepharis macularius TaxID=481883 RepID=A0AA97LI59_EUBMA|nr:zinc finger CCCH-type antiviral protein 1-like isoform X2 [Eublepharis macularius]
MSDPAVCSFITKILCAQGGGVPSEALPQHLELPGQQLERILQEAGNERFLVARQGLSCRVLAVSSVRLCLRNECGGCDCLHICKNYIQGRCYRPASGRGSCKYSHDVFSETNRKVLKNHELSGLNEDELRVLLLQNDPFLLPDVCNFYNKGEGNCQQDNCNKLHVCRFFLRGKCRFLKCKRSHNLLQPNTLKLLLAGGVDDKMAWNIQTICDHKTAELARELGSQKVHPSNPTVSTHGEEKKHIVGIEGEHKSSPDQASLLHVFMDHLQQQRPATRDLKSRGVGQEFPVKSSRYGDQGSLTPMPRPEARVKQIQISGVKAAPPPPPPKSTQDEEKKKNNEICLFYVWQFCKRKNNCDMIHYHLPYRWQVYTGTNWNDLSQMEEIEKAYCDPTITSLLNPPINFKTMMSYTNPVRRQSTPSSVTKPAKFIFTTKWLWYWKNDLNQWVEYGQQDGQRQGSSLSSDDLENLFLSQPDGTFQFQAGSQQYEINFKDMIQRNLLYQTQREVQRRPKYVSPEDVKKKKGHQDQSPASIPEPKYPKEWDKSLLPVIGYKSIEVSKASSEYTTMEKLFQKTMNDYTIVSIKRIQNPSLWQVFQWQKEQMKKKKGGQDIEEKLLFHGTGWSNLEAICNDNFDWRICGTNGTVYGKGSYFARDAQYSHKYCQAEAKLKNMFVARVLVGDFVVGHATYNRPPAKSAGLTNCYDSCVDKMLDPSIFVIFEKYQIYPAYIISYTEEKKCVVA